MKNITKKEFLEKGYIFLDVNGPEYSEFQISLYLDYFKKEVNIRIKGIDKKEAADKIAVAYEAVKNLLNSNIEITENIKKEIYQDYRDTVENAVMGIVNYEGFNSELEANEAHFKISSPKEAFERLKFNSIFTDLELAKKDVFNFYYDSPWYEYNCIDVQIQNGKSVYMETW